MLSSLNPALAAHLEHQTQSGLNKTQLDEKDQLNSIRQQSNLTFSDMSMICAISQQIPEEPVVSPISGCIFERRLITKYISEYGKDPVTNETLEESQLIEIKSSSKVAKPKLSSVSSIPTILAQLRDEWDACMLDSFELKQQLMTTRQELSHALYQLDASYRVIARLKGQVDELQIKLQDQNESEEQ